MPDIPALIHCHQCGYWSGPTTAEDGQVRKCEHCYAKLRVYRYSELHPRTEIGVNTFPVRIIRRGQFGNWIYELPRVAKPPYADAVSREWDKKRKRWIYYSVVDRRKLKDIYQVKRGGVMRKRAS